MEFGARGIRIISSLAALCVAAWAAAALAGDNAGEEPIDQPAAADLAGRWEGQSFALGRAAETCEDGPCTLTLDLSPCRDGWCGVEVGKKAACGTTALKLDGGTTGVGNVVFRGKLELARGTEPYTVEAYLRRDDGKPVFEIAGDTGGEFRVFRRSFPFNAALARIGDAKCRPEGAVSLLD
jgi:hypothetical protein